MGTGIKTWQIVNGELQPALASLKDGGRTEPYDLEPWIATRPEILGPDLMIIGRQVSSISGLIDLLAIDRMGNTVVPCRSSGRRGYGISRGQSAPTA